MKAVFFISEKETDVRLTSEARNIPMPDGTMRFYGSMDFYDDVSSASSSDAPSR